MICLSSEQLCRRTQNTQLVSVDIDNEVNNGHGFETAVLIPEIESEYWSVLRDESMNSSVPFGFCELF